MPNNNPPVAPVGFAVEWDDPRQQQLQVQAQQQQQQQQVNNPGNWDVHYADPVGNYLREAVFIQDDNVVIGNLEGEVAQAEARVQARRGQAARDALRHVLQAQKKNVSVHEHEKQLAEVKARMVDDSKETTKK